MPGIPPRTAREGYSPLVLLLPPSPGTVFSLLQPRDVTNFTVGGFAPMSPRISSPMHPSGAGECWGCTGGRRGVPKDAPPSPISILQANAVVSVAAA